MPPSNPISRRHLMTLLAGGLGWAGMAGALTSRPARAMGERPVTQGVVELGGEVRINGQPARPGQPLADGDRVEVGDGGRLIVVVGTDALLVRQKSQLAVSRGETPGGGALLRGVRLLSGQVLAVFGPGERQITTPVATLGIRGTGLYVESLPEHTYACTCYGVVELAARDDPRWRETVSTTHHESPRIILPPGGSAPRIQPAEMRNHTDEELILLEGVAGRPSPFPFQRGTPY